MAKDEHDPRIAMVAGWRPPRRHKPPSPWPGRLLLVAALPVVLVVALGGAEYVLGRDPRLPQVSQLADYRPLSLTRLRAPSGELVAEVGDTRRVVLSADKTPPAIARAIIARWDATFLRRDSLGQRELFTALRNELEHKPTPVPLSLTLARSLMTALPDRGLERLAKEWITALRFERQLTRDEILQLFVNQVAFGAGRYGLEEGARALFGRSAAALDGKQADALAALAGSETGAAWKPPAPTSAPGCGWEAARKLAERYDADALQHLGAEVVTVCDVELSRAVDEAIRRQHLERVGLHAVALVMRVPSHELAALGTSDTIDSAGARLALGAHRMGVLRVPLELAAALDSHKWTAASLLDDDGHPTPMRAITLRNPLAAADALVAVGLTGTSVADVASKLGLTAVADPAEMLSGKAELTPLEAMTVFATFAAAGQRRLPQLLRSVDGVEESPGAKAAAQAVSAEASYLAASMMPPPAAVRARLKALAAGVVSSEPTDAWFAAFTPDRAVVVWVGSDEGKQTAKPGEPARYATTIGVDALNAAIRALPRSTFERPPRLLARRVNAKGELLPTTDRTGMEELFIPGSLPHPVDGLLPEE